MKTSNPLVSIILPIYNSELYLKEAIDSVLQQTYSNWELIAINDGSNDTSEQIVQSYTDPRIQYHYQSNAGVSSARNMGLANMKGDFFCFLDADDYLPPNSIESRLAVFEEDSSIEFVDGVVLFKDSNLQHTLKTYEPHFNGNPFSNLTRLNEACFFGNTWMIKKIETKEYLFIDGLTHGEDLCFYLSFSQTGSYSFVKEPVLWYRQSTTSAMTNISALEKGYHYIYSYANQLGATKADLSYLKNRIRRIVFLSYLFNAKSLFKAIQSLFSHFS